MEVPCPVPLTQPWSPVGYQVVELPDGKPSGGERPPLVILAEQVSPPVAKSNIPSSPVGYRVVTVADENIPVPRRTRDTDIRLLMRERPRTSPWAIWLPVAAVALVVFVPALSLAVLLSQARARHEAPVMAAVVPQELVVPEGIRANAPAEQKADVAAQAEIPAVAPLPPDGKETCLDCDPFDVANQAKPAGQPRPDREGFDTAVEFVRNPQEAIRLAKQENKLTFILHLSGNFEDPGFT